MKGNFFQGMHHGGGGKKHGGKAEKGWKWVGPNGKSFWRPRGRVAKRKGWEREPNNGDTNNGGIKCILHLFFLSAFATKFLARDFFKLQNVLCAADICPKQAHTKMKDMLFDTRPS